MLLELKRRIKENSFLYFLFLSVYHFPKVFPVVLFNLRKFSLFIKVRPFTMVPFEGLNNVHEICRLVEDAKIEGNFVECGVWNGGCAAVMGAVDKRYGSGRQVVLVDSFEGLPEPVTSDGSRASEYSSGRADGRLKAIGQLVGSIENVKTIFGRLGIDQNKVRIEKGWFQDVLPRIKRDIGQIAVLRLDGDWYESTKVCLENLYGNVVSNGYVIIDDYGCWEGCRKAVDEFLKENGLRVELQNVNGEIHFFRKP